MIKEAPAAVGALLKGDSMNSKRFIKYVFGYYTDYKNNKLFNLNKIQVNYTSDKIGKTLSLGVIGEDIQISIPFDEIEKLIRSEHDGT